MVTRYRDEVEGVYIIDAVDGTYNTSDLQRGGRQNRNSNSSMHQLAVKGNGTIAGTLTILARGVGSTVFEPVPDGLIDLAAPTTVLFQFALAEYQFQLAGFAGTAQQLTITDSPV